MTIDIRQSVWAEKYRPTKLEDCVFPKDLATKFQTIISDGMLPNLLLQSKTPGVGKTTIAKILCEELGYEYITINGSNDRNIDMLRTKLTDFAETSSMTGKRKCVIIDEADFLNATSTQPALRGLIQDYASNCSFIFTCNLVNRLSDAIRSRFAEISFDFTQEDQKYLMINMLKRAEYILNEEGIEYEKKAVAVLIKKVYPRFRTVLIELQNLSLQGSIVSSTVIKLDEIEEVIDLLKKKSFNSVRTWVEENQSIGIDKICEQLDKHLDSIFVQEFVPHAILLMADYLHKGQNAILPQINLMAMFTEMMHTMEFKN